MSEAHSSSARLLRKKPIEALGQRHRWRRSRARPPEARHHAVPADDVRRRLDHRHRHLLRARPYGADRGSRGHPVLRHRRRRRGPDRAVLCRNGLDDPGLGLVLLLCLCNARRRRRLLRGVLPDPRIRHLGRGRRGRLERLSQQAVRDRPRFGAAARPALGAPGGRRLRASPFGGDGVINLPAAILVFLCCLLLDPRLQGIGQSQRHHGPDQDGRPGRCSSRSRSPASPRSNLQPFAPFGFAGHQRRGRHHLLHLCRPRRGLDGGRRGREPEAQPADRDHRRPDHRDHALRAGGVDGARRPAGGRVRGPGSRALRPSCRT